MNIGFDFDGVVVDKVSSTPLPNSKEILKQLLLDGHTLYIISCRDIKYINKVVVKEMGINIPGLIVGDLSEKDKIKFIKDYNREKGLDLFIDDNKEIIKKLDIPCLYFNRSDYTENAIGVNNWQEVYEIISSSYVFSPGPVKCSIDLDIDFTHRGKVMRALIKDTMNKFKDKFKIPYSKGVVFTGGSGTSAVESVISSIVMNRKVAILVNGEFGKRLYKISQFYNPEYIKTFSSVKELEKSYKSFEIVLACQFETSTSIYNNLVNLVKKCKSQNILTVIDCVSSFGYYSILDADFVMTSSSKIIGAVPVMGIVVYNKKMVDMLYDNNYYLSLRRHIEYFNEYQTPHTSLIPQIYSLNKSLSETITKYDIDENRKVFKNIFNKLEIVGDTQCHVLTYKLPDWVDYVWFREKLNKYNIEVYFGKKYLDKMKVFQVSFFSERELWKYTWLALILKKILSDGEKK